MCHFCLLPNRTLPTRLWQKILLCAAMRATRLVIGSIGQTQPRHTAAARQKHRCASHGASLAAETMLRRKSCVQPVLGLRSQGQQSAACFKARVVSMVCPLDGRRGSVGEGGGEDAISGSGWWIRLIKRGRGGEWARRDQPWDPPPAPSNLPGADLMVARPSNRQQESQANFPVIPTFAIRAKIDAVLSGKGGVATD